MTLHETAPGIFSNVVEIASEDAIEAAWENYAAHMRQATDNPALLTDRGWTQRRAVLNRRFDQLYLAGER